MQPAADFSSGYTRSQSGTTAQIRLAMEALTTACVIDFSAWPQPRKDFHPAIWAYRRPLWDQCDDACGPHLASEEEGRRLMATASARAKALELCDSGTEEPSK